MCEVRVRECVGKYKFISSRVRLCVYVFVGVHDLCRILIDNYCVCLLRLNLGVWSG